MACVYVSSTFSDLESFRACVREALRKRGHEDIAMELYGARDERPLEKCLRDVEDCDLYIGIFAWRYGFIPPGEKKSITELEFSKAVECEKSRLLFLLAEDAPWPGNLYERAKYQEVDALRKRVSEDRVVEHFLNEDQLSAKVTDAIVRWEEQHGIEPPPNIIDWDHYKDQVKKEHQWVRLSVIAGPRHEKVTTIPLVEVFTPQLAQAKLPDYDVPDEVLEARKRFFESPIVVKSTEEENSKRNGAVPDILPDQEEDETSATFPESVFEVIARERTQVIVGGPGTGKTTLVHYSMLRLADAGRSTTPLPLHIQPSAIPFLVDLRQYLLSEATDFTQYIATNCARRYATEVDPDAVESLLNEDGRSLVFFDGLDEVFDLADRGRVIQQFKSFAGQYPNAKIIVTTRIAGYQPDELQLANFKHYTLLDFNIQQATVFVRRWYTYYTWEGDERTAAGLIQRIAENPRLMELAGNPLLLTMMAIIYKHQELPEKRWELYERATSVLLEDWDVKRKLIKQDTILSLPDDVRMGKDQKAKLLQRVSNYMLEHGQSGKELNAIAYPQLIDMLTRFLQEEYGRSPGSARDLASEILSYLRERTYILAEVGEHIYGFVHRTFMEYFAASHIRAEFNSKKADYGWLNKEVFSAHWKQDEWREVLFLLIAMLADQASPVNEVIEYIDGLEDDLAFQKAFAARCLAEAGVTGHKSLSDSLLIDLANAVNEHIDSRAQLTSEFIEEALLAFSLLARMVPVPREIHRIIQSLNEKGSLRARMAAWQLGFAMQSGEERLKYALEAVQAPEEAVRRAAVRVLEREWPGRDEVKTALIKVVREDRYARVKQAALDVLQRGWPNDELILEAIEANLKEELAYTYAERLVDYLTISWAGVPKALELVLQLVGSRFKPTEFGRPDINDHAVRAIAQGWGGAEDALSLLSHQTDHNSSLNVRIVSVRALAAAWAADPAALSLAKDYLSNDDNARLRMEAVRALAAGWAAEPAALSLLQDRLSKDNDAAVRIETVRALATAWGGDPIALSLLRDCLSNEKDTLVRIETMRALATGWGGDSTALPLLRDCLINEKGIFVQIEAIRALVAEHPPEPVSVSLVRDCILLDSKPMLRCAAIACSFGDIGIVGPYINFIYNIHDYPIGYIAYRVEQNPRVELDRIYYQVQDLGLPVFSNVVELFKDFLIHQDNLYFLRSERRFWTSSDLWWRMNEWRLAMLEFVLDRSALDCDVTVRATAITYATLYGQEDKRLELFLEARRNEELDESLRNYIDELAKFMQRRPVSGRDRCFDVFQK